MRFAFPPCGCFPPISSVADQKQANIDYQGGGEEQAVQAVQHAAVAREESRGVLDLGLALEHGLEQVSQEPHHGQDQGQNAQALQTHPGRAHRPRPRPTIKAAAMPPHTPAQVFPGLTSG